jgi:TrmH family RNA methyltransferase
MMKIVEKKKKRTIPENSMKTITSAQNQLIKTIASLQTTKGRKETGWFVAEGLRTVATFIQQNWEPLYLVLTEEAHQQIERLGKKEQYIIVSPEVMRKISSAISPSGILAVFAIPQAPAIEKLNAGIVLADVSDPGNMGTLIRTCAALGKRSIVIIEGTDPWSPKVVQASAGIIAHVDIFTWTWQDLVAHKRTKKLIALVVSGGMHPQSIDASEGLLIIGSEAHGIPIEWVKECDYQVTIPMPGGTESLNAATAGAIGMYLAWAPKKQ